MNNRQIILQWQRQGAIKTQDLEKSLTLTQAQNSGQQWFDFISKNLILFGLASLAVGVIFFFAYNWDNMGTMMKFALLQGLLIASTLFYTQTKRHSHTATGILLFIALLIGALLALFGQTYQTGKDPWQLFFMWSMFVIPLAYVSKNSLLWILWLALINLSLFLFMSVHNWFWGFVFRDENTVMAFAVLNVLVSLLFFYLIKLDKNNKMAAVFYLSIISSAIAITWVGFYAVSEDSMIIYLIAYLLWIAAIYYFYRIKSTDVLILSAWSLSLILVGLASLSHMMDGDWNGGRLLMLSLILIASSTFATRWLMALLQQEQLEQVSEEQGEKA